MGRGRNTTLDDLSGLPWPVPLVSGIIAYYAIRHGVPAWMANRGGPFGQAFEAHGDALAPVAWMVLAFCTLASLVSFFRARHRRRLLDTRAGLDSIATLGWRDFERLVGEAYRRQGYSVEETGLGGADGGIDLILTRDGQRTLVQCKRWRRDKVTVNIVREMYGLLAHHGAHQVRIATVGGFTRDAAYFAAGKPIELIDGQALLAMVREVQDEARSDRPAPARTPASRLTPVVDATAPAIVAIPDCPRCGSGMAKRTNPRANTMFWGCTSFPRCRGTR
ncbi:restriction endonuclease [Luteimonas sp. YGD11-2]|uniref:restriction endonuclease n=1 Tax=Luteimonas sp. YGD11-2 TaxID=2508168 RepID=UPI00100AAEEF|nr:restriction endonuclease [Luteimonas sp. YGD11-2]